MRTLTDYQNTIEHAVGGTMDSRHTSTQMVNDAGRFLFRMHEWPWRTAPPLELSLEPDQETIELPADFGDIIDLSVPNGVIYTIELSSLEQVEARRNYAQFDAYRFWVAVAWPGQGGKYVGAKVPRLEIYPSINSIQGGPTPVSFTLIYRRNWVEMDEATQVPNIRPEYERLLLEICRAMAKGVEDDEDLLLTPSIQVQLELLKSTAGTTQADMGAMRGGAVESSRGPSTLWPHRRITRS